MSPSEDPRSDQPPSTATTAGARDHARAMAGTVVDAMPVVPASQIADPPVGVDPADLLWDEVVAGGGYTSLAVARGAHIRLVDLEGDACAGVLIHRHDHPSERLNVADTVKVQWQAYLEQGQLMLSDMGRALASIVEDTSGRHDTICGTTNRATNHARYGDGSMQGPAPNGRDLFALALAKHGRNRRDVAPNVNFFKGTRVGPDGSIELLESAAAGSAVVLRCELDLLVTIVNVAHPLDDRPGYRVTPVRVTAWRGAPASPEDRIRRSTPERERAFLNTEAAVGMLS